MQMRNIISIVSGKGGCGKSLLTTILGRALSREGKKVLIIDMDIFVRGLTVLLYDFKKRQSDKTLLTVSEIFGIFAEDSEKRKPINYNKSNLAFERFFECDVLPAVSNIGDPLDYNDKDLSNQQFCDRQIRKLLDTIGDEYDFILLDNRAGMDSLVLSSCLNSNFVLTIAEDDDVGKQTNLNLVNFLRFNKKVKNIYSIINKARNIKDYESLKERVYTKSDFNLVGIIPFDMEILENFGSEHFWITVNETLYFKAVIDSWNQLSRSENVIEISESKYRFPHKVFMKKSDGKYTLIERMLRLYSITFIIGGLAIYIYSKYRFEQISLLDLVSLISLGLGFTILILSTSNIRTFLMGSRTKGKY
jgi:cellulose biosynthesis protein BcsQ